MNRESRLCIAEWHAFEALRFEAAGNAGEAREHLNDAKEQLENAGLDARQIETATDVFAMCAEARADGSVMP